MEVLDIFWDYRIRSESRTGHYISYPLHDRLHTKLSQHQHWEVAVKSLIFSYPKSAFSAFRKVTPIISIHFNHLDVTSINDAKSESVLHRFPLPTFPVEMEGDRMHFYEWNPDTLFFMKAITMPSPPPSVTFEFRYGGGPGIPVDMKNILFSIRLVYRKVENKSTTV